MMSPMNNQNPAAVEFALKAYSVGSDRRRFDVDDGAIEPIAVSVDWAEAPEDAVCSLVVDLMHYCERANIDWRTDVIPRVRERFERRTKRSMAQPMSFPKQSEIELPLLKLLHQLGGKAQPKELYPKLRETFRNSRRTT